MKMDRENDENLNEFECEWMKELHLIREKMYEETKNMTHEERRAYIKKGADRAISKLKNKPKLMQKS